MITDALQKITSWVQDPQLTEMEKFLALYEYYIKTLLPEVNEQQVQQYYTGKSVSLSPEYIRASDVAFFVDSHFLGFLCARYNVPKEKWADLVPLFMDAVREILSLPGRPFDTPDFSPLLRKALNASSERRYELAKQGYFTIEEVHGWGEMGH